MANGLNDVTFIKGQGGLGRPLPGEDYISGMVFYAAALPSGFTSSDRIKRIFSVEEAEDLGITNTFSDETKATGSYLVTAPGAAGDTLELKVLEYSTTDNPTGSVSLGVLTRSALATTAALVAADYVALVNSGTATHGYTATLSTATVLLTARTGLGIFLNTGTPISATIVGTVAGTITQFSGGVASLLNVWHYHISEYFRLQPKGDLHVGFYAVPTTYDFAEVATIQHYAVGKIRQFAVYANGTTYTSAKVQAAQTVANTLESEHMPCSIVVTFNYAAATLSTLADLSGLNSPKVSVVIGQDGGAVGYRLYKATGYSITTLGAVLGLVSVSAVQNDIAWVGAFNIAGGEENDIAAFANGALYSSTSTAQLNALNTSRYIFLRKQVGYAGTWVNDSHCAVLASSDYAYIENNRVIDKAIRNLRTGYLPFLNSDIVLESTGKMTATTVATLEGVGEVSLDQMVRDANISARSVTIDPEQNVLSTNTLAVSVVMVPIGIARNIVIKIKYALSL